MRVILWIALIFTTVVTVSGQRSMWPWSRYRGMMSNRRCISCSDVKKAHLCESCCKRSACTPNPCKNNATCLSVDNGYSCSCTPGYFGENCDVNVCLPNPCKNNGTCSPVDNGYRCNCTTGYLGETCDVNPCNVYDPCVNNGTCYPSEFIVNCSCPTGFIGAFCQEPEDTPQVAEERVCNFTQCDAINENCEKLLCLDAGNCTGKTCEPDDLEGCVDGTCAFFGDVCFSLQGDNYVFCQVQGEPCGDGNFCSAFSKCVNDICRPLGSCDERAERAGCTGLSLTGACVSGFCRVPCSNDQKCKGYPCVDGFCADVYCGESFCTA
ncbi:adhesive plaque matrix protein 2 [Patella vulgata]|uniref:adhesive plaque matrix protein 2 n=1 Tax=Patella vulgata TaxID=6465 RepID=UPI0024A7BFB2|nr:adhesive plaque matrix protein 2 [Patella vulgata]